ncbi:MAG: glycine zipper domain-containing protein [Pseudomonas sp.]|uniref:glycine zipper domain-containing protein n=1 Tax=Pseudomonas sp. TaxID=306 RepID=UPI003D6F73C5
MSKTIDNLTETLSEDLYEKTRRQLNTFIHETNALLAAGDALHEDRTTDARERLANFLKGAALNGAAASAVGVQTEQPPLTRVISDAKSYVKSHPWVAVGAAAGVGLIVSMLLNRRQP